MELLVLRKATVENCAKTALLTLFAMLLSFFAFDFAVVHGFRLLGNAYYNNYADEDMAARGILFSAGLMLPIAVWLRKRSHLLARLGFYSVVLAFL